MAIPPVGVDNATQELWEETQRKLEEADDSMSDISSSIYEEERRKYDSVVNQLKSFDPMSMELLVDLIWCDFSESVKSQFEKRQKGRVEQVNRKILQEPNEFSEPFKSQLIEQMKEGHKEWALRVEQEIVGLQEPLKTEFRRLKYCLANLPDPVISSKRASKQLLPKRPEPVNTPPVPSETFPPKIPTTEQSLLKSDKMKGVLRAFTKRFKSPPPRRHHSPTPDHSTHLSKNG